MLTQVLVIKESQIRVIVKLVARNLLITSILKVDTENISFEAKLVT